jgi:UDP-sugar pyrophosphorylase
MLASVGAEVAPPTRATFNGLQVELYPRVSWAPAFAQTFADLKQRVTGGAAVRLGPKAALVIEGEHVQLKVRRHCAGLAMACFAK